MYPNNTSESQIIKKKKIFLSRQKRKKLVHFCRDGYKISSHFCKHIFYNENGQQHTEKPNTEISSLKQDKKSMLAITTMIY